MAALLEFQAEAAGLQRRYWYLITHVKRVKDKYGHYVCILYHSKPDGSVDRNMYFNKMLLESVHASLQDFYSNEFSHS